MDVPLIFWKLKCVQKKQILYDKEEKVLSLQIYNITFKSLEYI